MSFIQGWDVWCNYGYLLANLRKMKLICVLALIQHKEVEDKGHGSRTLNISKHMHQNHPDNSCNQDVNKIKTIKITNDSKISSKTMTGRELSIPGTSSFV